MAGGGGGSWKVAYADFVTAMMAFFMVMWLVGQDQNIRKSVAQYFIDPIGVSSKPTKSGAVADSPASGSIPENESTTVGKGRMSHTPPKNEKSETTKSVSDFIHKDEKASKQWKKEAEKARDMAARSSDVKNKLGDVNEIAKRNLAKKLQEQFLSSIPPQAKGVYQDILYNSMNGVNWTELAEDLLDNP
jgi:chemotaxis protein MotB